MSTPSPFMRDLARRLYPASGVDSDPQGNEADKVVEKLRVVLTTFAGSQGFETLMRRASSLAAAEVASLKVAGNGSDESFAQDETAIAVLAHLLGLLETFVGRPLALMLVREAWPDLPLDSYNFASEGD